MTAQTKTTLKTYFNTGDTPSEAQFANFIDTLTPLAEAQTWSAKQTYQKAAAATGSFTPLTFEPQDAGARKWNFCIGSTANAGDGTRTNVMMNWGFNQIPTGGCEDITDDTLYLNIESYYAANAVRRNFEFYLMYFGPGNTPYFRPFGINVNRAADETPYYTEHTYAGDRINFMDRMSVFQMGLFIAGATQALSQFIALAPTVLRSDGALLTLQKTDSTDVFTFNSTSAEMLIVNSNGFINSNTSDKILYFQNWHDVVVSAPLWMAGATNYLVGHLVVTDEKNITFNTGTGTKIGTSVTEKIGFWNVTPVVQQTLATGAGATVDNVITMLQTIGLCKQA